jgi:NAD(P)-dependent dehydrogenase (short-subunit alcohol dehydrogenase family)
MDDAADIDRLAKEAEAAMGKLDVLVNNAGISLFAKITEISGAGSERPLGHRGADLPRRSGRRPALDHTPAQY